MTELSKKLVLLRRNSPDFGPSLFVHFCGLLTTQPTASSWRLRALEKVSSDASEERGRHTELRNIYLSGNLCTSRNLERELSRESHRNFSGNGLHVSQNGNTWMSHALRNRRGKLRRLSFCFLPFSNVGASPRGLISRGKDNTHHMFTQVNFSLYSIRVLFASADQPAFWKHAFRLNVRSGK